MSNLIKGINESLSEFESRLFAASLDELSRERKAGILGETRASQHNCRNSSGNYNAYVRLCAHIKSLSSSQVGPAPRGLGAAPMRRSPRSLDRPIARLHTNR